MEREHRTDSDAPIDIGARAANVLRKRVEELKAEHQAEIVARVEVRDVTPNSFNCEIRFETVTDPCQDHLFWRNGVRLAVSSDHVTIVRGMKLVYYDGILNVRQCDCLRKPHVKSYARTISVHSVMDEKVNPDGHMYYTSGETDDERRKGNQIREPVEPPKSASLTQVEQLLDCEGGLTCLPRFFREQCFRTVRRESDSFLDRYYNEQLALIKTHIEPLARDDADGGHPGFYEVCMMLVDSPNLGALALTIGFDQPNKFDPTLWLTWAVQRHDDPATCLYCTANFLAVPPFAGDVPQAVDGAVKALLGMSLLALEKPTSALQIIEAFLGLSVEDYCSLPTMQGALNRSGLDQLEAMPRMKMIETLADALRLVQQRGAAQAKLVLQASGAMLS